MITYPPYSCQYNPRITEKNRVFLMKLWLKNDIKRKSWHIFLGGGGFYCSAGCIDARTVCIWYQSFSTATVFSWEFITLTNFFSTPFVLLLCMIRVIYVKTLVCNCIASLVLVKVPRLYEACYWLWISFYSLERSLLL